VTAGLGHRASGIGLSGRFLSTGTCRLRIAAHNTSNDKGGSVFAEVDVPDFANLPLSLSGVMLDSATVPISAPPKALAALLPITPTTDREFSTTSQVRAFLKIYEGGRATIAPVTLSVTITDERDATIYSTTASVNALKFASDRSASFPFDLPLTALAPGEYLLSFNDVIFTMR
jgi:hypothetical protein